MAIIPPAQSRPPTKQPIFYMILTVIVTAFVWITLAIIEPAGPASGCGVTAKQWAFALFELCAVITLTYVFTKLFIRPWAKIVAGLALFCILIPVGFYAWLYLYLCLTF